MAIKGEPTKDSKGSVQFDLLAVLNQAGYTDRNQQATILRETARLAEALAPIKTKETEPDGN